LKKTALEAQELGKGHRSSRGRNRFHRVTRG